MRLLVCSLRTAGSAAAPANAEEAMIDDEPPKASANASDAAALADLPFTPKEVSSQLCMARTWNSGMGGQCRMSPTKGSDFCTRHGNNDAWQVHGRLDGPIPEKKLKEFEKAARTSSKPKAASDKGERCKRAKLSGVSASRASEDADVDVPASSRAVRAKRQDQGTVLSDEETTAESQPRNKSAGHSGLKRRATSTKAPREKKVPAKLPKPAKAKSAKSSGAKAKGPKCTCGKPIHSEKCKLFGLGFLHSQKRFAVPSRPSVTASPGRALPPPSVQLSRAAREQVTKISEEIAQLPEHQRKVAWKNQMRMFHPDKCNQSGSVFPNLSEEQMNEVFVEIKRRYDFAMQEQQNDLIPPARQFWGCGTR
ncbi:unnamed protein product [Effrenium voratum]|uniref:Uncharacterized protein n=1 Tax=Effrenium voratum TaxID=2562239 RepID=A0AA36HNR3_9DINO|nr:unnamed protein product [Effrenium voratum]